MLFVGDEEVQPEKVYRAAFITEQGVPAKFGQNRKQHPDKMVAVMQQYLKKNGPVEMKIQGTYTAI